MKKYALLIFAVIIFTAFTTTFTSCRSEISKAENQLENLEKSQYPDFSSVKFENGLAEISDDLRMSENVYITIDEGQNFTTDKDIEKIMYTLHNNAEYGLLGDRIFEIELRIGGEWRKIPGGIFEMIAFEIPPQKTFAEGMKFKDWNFDDFKFVPGHYRVIKKFGINNLTLENQTPLGYSLLTYAEFNIE
jgi:hypothetical protein